MGKTVHTSSGMMGTQFEVLCGFVALLGLVAPFFFSS